MFARIAERTKTVKGRLAAAATSSAATMAAGVVMLAGTASAAAGSYSLFGDASSVSPGNNSPAAIQTESSSTAPGYGGIDFSVPSGMTLNDLNTLATDFEATSGGCGGGSPRFQVNVTTPSGTENLFVYLGTAPNYTCATNTWISSGNLLTPTSLVDATQLGGSFYETYSDVQAAYGSYPVTGVQLVTDAGWLFGTQTMRFDNTQINSSTYGYENKDSCKNNGWKSFTSAPGPFKNQGDCVSYFATNGKNTANPQ